MLTGAGIAALLGISALAIFFFQPYGERQWISLALAAIMGGLILAHRRKRVESILTVSRAGPNVYGLLRPAAKVVIGVLGGWLALIGWSSLSPGGSMPPAKSQPEIIRVVTWNILHGTEHGAPWSRFGWAVRKRAARAGAAGGGAGDPLRAGGP